MLRIRTGMVLTVALAVLIAAALPGAAQEAESWEGASGAARFAPIDWLEGEWTGYGEFPDRTNYIHKEYYYDIAGIYLIERTLALFPPPAPSTDFEAHQDFTVFYRDSATGGFRSKGFFVEAFVTSSTVDVSPDGSLIVIESHAVENAPEGMRSRMTISRETEDSYSATFEIAMPGSDYSLYEELTMSRVK